MSLSGLLRKKIVVGAIITLLVISAGLYARLRYVNKRLVAQVTQSIRLAAALDEAVAEGRGVCAIAIESGAGRGVLEAGAKVTSRVAARVERTSESGGDATVEVRRSAPDINGREGLGEMARGRLTLHDDHGRFEASADYSYSQIQPTPRRDVHLLEDESSGGHKQRKSSLTIGPVAWRIHQVFKIETVEFSQRYEGETLWRGYSVTLTEVSPKTGAELERWVVPYEQIDAEYVPSRRLRQWALFSSAGFSYSDDDPGFYGEFGLRVRQLSGAVGITDEVTYGRVGWYKEW